MAVAVTCVAGVLVCRWLGHDARALRFRSVLGGVPLSYRRLAPGVPRVWSV